MNLGLNIPLPKLFGAFIQVQADVIKRDREEG